MRRDPVCLVNLPAAFVADLSASPSDSASLPIPPTCCRPLSLLASCKAQGAKLPFPLAAPCHLHCNRDLGGTTLCWGWSAQRTQLRA